jgi:methyltransferase-like protein
MLFQNDDSSSPEQQMNHARARLQFIAEASNASDAYRSVLEDGLEQVITKDDYSLFHDEMGAINNPCYFKEFAHGLSSNGLQYLGDAGFSELNPDHDISEDALQRLDELAGDRIAREQFLDFLNNRRFRRSLICHDQVQRAHQSEPDRMMSLFVESSAQPLSDDAHSGDATGEFKTASGTIVETDTPLTTALFHYLSEAWPRWTPCSELLNALSQYLQPDDDKTAQIDPIVLADTLRSACSLGLVRLHAMASPFKSQVSALPAASSLARVQARDGTLVTNLRHESLDLGDSLGRELLLLADGTRDRKSIARELMGRIEEGTISTEVVMQSCGGIEPAGNDIHYFIERDLKTIVDNALLVS